MTPKVPATSWVGQLEDLVLRALSGDGEALDDSPASRAKLITKKAALRAGAMAGLLPVPGGALGIIGLLPDVIGVWRVQSQMLRELGETLGRPVEASQSEMIHGVGRQVAAQLARDVVVHAGERVLVRQIAHGLVRAVAKRGRVKTAPRGIGAALLQGVPLMAAAAVAAFAYFDTERIGARAIAALCEPAKPAESADSAEPATA